MSSLRHPVRTARRRAATLKAADYERHPFVLFSSDHPNGLVLTRKAPVR